MRLSENPGALEKFHLMTWKFQKTFKTPLQNLQSFVEAIMSAYPQIVCGCLTIEQVVFEPKQLLNLLGSNARPQSLVYGAALTAEGRPELGALLRGALSDWLDFTFIPKPKAFGIYADHDEYITFYAQSRANLNRVVSTLDASGFKPVPNYDHPR